MRRAYCGPRWACPERRPDHGLLARRNPVRQGHHAGLALTTRPGGAWRSSVCPDWSRAGRKNGWTLAEHAGGVCPDGMQRLLRRADWERPGSATTFRVLVSGQLGDQGGVLIGGDTGFTKEETCGVRRQCSGTAGRTGNCQAGHSGR